MLSLHPATEGVLTDIDWLKRKENFLKKKFQKVLVIKKEVLLLHPLTQRVIDVKAQIKRTSSYTYWIDSI
jgi:aspartate carbamoyltransferase catalytic subunit